MNHAHAKESVANVLNSIEKHASYRGASFQGNTRKQWIDHTRILLV